MSMHCKERVSTAGKASSDKVRYLLRLVWTGKWDSGSRCQHLADNCVMCRTQGIKGLGLCAAIGYRIRHSASHVSFDGAATVDAMYTWTILWIIQLHVCDWDFDERAGQTLLGTTHLAKFENSKFGTWKMHFTDIEGWRGQINKSLIPIPMTPSQINIEIVYCLV